MKIVKDSSANKCGVITSSFEIGGCMALDEQEFMAIKPRFVEEVLAKLRQLAHDEAMLLMQEGRRRTNTSLPQISTHLSRVANGAAAAIAAAIPTWPEADRNNARLLVFDHLPRVLVETAADRVWTRMPEAYLNWMQASRLASSMLYREGIDFLDNLEAGAIAELARRYLAKDLQMRRLIVDVEASDLDVRERVAEVLRRSGTRAPCRICDPRVRTRLRREATGRSPIVTNRLACLGLAMIATASTFSAAAPSADPAADPILAESRIVAVTVYRDEAAITRRASSNCRRARASSASSTSRRARSSRTACRPASTARRR